MEDNQDRAAQDPGGGSRKGKNSGQSGDDLLTVAEVAKWLGFQPKTLYAWAASGKIPRVRISNRVRFCRGTILRWLEARKEG